jgi:peptidoglycan/LPS O-acetylase OafA/YrhL
MTALIILHHTAITYGGSGGWFWREYDTSAAPSSLLLTLFCATNQAYFMGFFFLLAAYYTPRSLERKGYGKFLLDRFLRLGLPLLFFILVLGPVTAAIVDYAIGNGFWPTIRFLWNHQRIINGPLWFAQALLIFSLGYCLWRAAFGSKLTSVQQQPKPLPAGIRWLLGALGVAALSLAVRLYIPVGTNVFGLQLAYFPGYVFLFAIGIAAWRHNWLSQLVWKQARPWIVTMGLAWPCLPIGILLAKHLQSSGNTDTNGGLTWTAALYALWEPLVAWGAICLWLLIFRKRMNQPSAFWDWLNRRAYAVYIFHPPVLVGIALLLHGWQAPPLMKFAVTGSLTIAACWLISDPIVRLPGIRRII